jgi:hypothetical protein
MRKELKVLLFASLLAAGTAFAGGDSTDDPYAGLMPDEEAALAQSEGEVIYVYPVEVTEYTFVIPSESGEMPG